jgi:REP element-mobilizing transposase RayT
MVQMDVVLESTTGGAYRALARRRYDLAIIPERDSQKPAYSLRAIQPDLAVVVTATSADDMHVEFLKKHYDGVLRAELIESDLPLVLAKIWWPNVRSGVVTRIGSTQGRRASDSQLQALCNSLEALDGLQQVILTRAGEIVICGGSDEANAKAVAEQIRQSWDDEPRTAQIKILPFSGQAEPVMWYTIPTASYLLTVAAQPDAPVYRVRRQATQLARILDTNYTSQEFDESQLNVQQDQSVAGESLGRAYHLVWWPLDPMPQYVRQLVSGYIRKLAQANACVIHKLDVTARAIHIFVTCPPGRMSCWAADLFKKGVQDEIRARFGYSIELWQKGYFAADAEHPPTESELKFVLGPLASTFAGA